MKKLFVILSIFSFSLNFVTAQSTEAGPHDFGRMWTFENAPKQWVNTTYNFNPSDDWWNNVRMSALRMNTGCSASFVTPDGLILTNHHCSRDAVLKIQKDGEDIMKDGFVAYDSNEERLVPGVFFEQLVKFEDVTPLVKKYTKKSKSADAEKSRAEALDSIKAHFSKLEGWDGLRLQIVSYYSGVKYSIYGYKKYSNIKLVAIPEADIAFFGGDPDNFTFPRYDVDFTFWRAYDDEGNMINSADNYFKFSDETVLENDLVFVVGNPGNTERYRTVDQLTWDKNQRYPLLLDLLNSKLEKLQEEYDKDPNEYTMNEIFSIANSYKAYNGIQEGLMDERLFQRKVDIENQVRKNYKGDDYWNKLKSEIEVLAPETWVLFLFGPTMFSGETVMKMHAWYNYENALTLGNKSDAGDLKDMLQSQEFNLNDAETLDGLKNTLAMALKYAPESNSSVKELFDGKTSDQFVDYLVKKSKFYNGDEWKSYLDMDAKKLMKKDDPFLQMTRTFIPQFNKAAGDFTEAAPKMESYEGNIAKEYFRYFGDILPPDASFTLRISDGLVKGYDYNGTQAPYKTTFYGMYDRYYSFNKKFPWDLPERWLNPPVELLSAPLDFVSTNDIIGGNSGSPIINKDKQLVGLIFDGNIESLPGNFIFDEKSNRAVSVCSTGILASLKYIYKANNLVEELKGAGR